jgi:hypothetical protein
MALTTSSTKVNLPEDVNSVPIQVASIDYANSVVGAIGPSSARVTLPTTTKLIQITNTQDMWVKFGDNTVTASAAAGSVLFVAGERVIQTPEGVTHMAFIQDSTAGNVCVACAT